MVFYLKIEQNGRRSAPCLGNKMVSSVVDTETERRGWVRDLSSCAGLCLALCRLLPVKTGVEFLIYDVTLKLCHKI